MCLALDGHDKYWLEWVGIGKLVNKIGGIGTQEFIVIKTRGEVWGYAMLGVVW